ncbi:unnamed protein product [Kluyveromyces dobzhanskii CBS 2104]|uniref:WGS project CCBQ000000000 data, contig 00098 n=1 Tax=Kluyveromyces dobzhanskii CBS 2104 TaxID=1427455 RepID=A0A0A8L5E7_9SACH|nr:unnamed protein product [Kluyveromyces dobzhanskii CBS 2104]
MTEAELPVSNGRKQGILSFFRNPGKPSPPASANDGDSNTAVTIDLDNESLNQSDSSDAEREEEAEEVGGVEVDNSQKSATLTEEEDQEETEKADGVEVDDDAASMRAKKKVERELRRAKEKEAKLKRKEEERLEREKNKLIEKQKRDKQKQERELKKQQEKEEREQKRLQEKEERERKKQQEKEERERKRIEEKEMKEQERLKKEEKRSKKEEEIRKKEEAKEKSQSRIGNFFRKATVSSSEQSATSDFEKYFLPFYVKSDVVMANDWKLDPPKLKENVSRIDELMKSEDTSSNFEWLNSFKCQHGYEIKLTAVEVLQIMTSKKKTDEELSDLLSKVPQKFIKFYENVRPPYVGTYSKKLTLQRNNPFSTEGTGFDYGYDSDLDWVNEEEEEGGVDDLENDDEEDEEDQDEEDEGDNEMDGFLDKDDSENISRKKFVGPLIPTIKLRNDLHKHDDESKHYFALVSVECLFQDLTSPVDPLKAPTKRAYVEEVNSSKSNSTSTSPIKKAKNLISNPKHVLAMLEQVHDCTFSLSTVTEIVQKHLPQYKKDTIKNSIKEYAAKSTKGDRRWQVKDANIWEDLKKSPPLEPAVTDIPQVNEEHTLNEV